MNETIYSLTLAATGFSQTKRSKLTTTTTPNMSTGPAVQQHNIPHGKTQRDQPKFIRKKPQIIQSIEFAQELKQPEESTNMPRQSNLFVEDDQLRLAEPPNDDNYKSDRQCETPNLRPEYASPQSLNEQNHQDEQLLITKMMDELKQRKQEQILKSNGSSVYQIKDEIIPSPLIVSSPETIVKSDKKSSAKRSKSPQVREYEDLKLKKIEQLKQMLINEKGEQKNYISGTQMQQPYATTVSKNDPEDGYKSESTVQYVNESTSNVKRQSLSATKPKKQVQQRSKSRELKQKVKVSQSSAQIQQTSVQGQSSQYSEKPQKNIHTSQQPIKAAPSQYQGSQIQTNRNLTPNQDLQLSRFEPPAPSNQRVVQAAMIDLTPIKSQPVLIDHVKHNFVMTSPSAISQQNRNQTDFMNFQSQQQTQLLSEKTQQIFFKKLQKDIEQAIRQADASEKGFLTMDELKLCFFNLDYLPFILMEMQNGTNYPRFGNPRNYITTNKSLILQEKEFMYNFWCIINPLNSPEVDNALLYDIILLMIYNVQQPLGVCVGQLNEYLDNLYREQGIDIEKMSNFNSSTSQILNGQTISNLSRYLSLSNIWSIEKLVHEFKQIHANKLSNTFSTNKRTQQPPALSTSPISHHTPQHILINPTDGRKYKKQVVEDHLSHLTFSPTISSRTKKLDQQVTRKLMQESSRSRSKNNRVYEEPNSHQISSFQNRPIKVYHREVEGDDISEVEQEQENTDNYNRYELLLYRQMITDEKIRKAKENKLQKMLEECTFHPTTNQQRNTVTLQGSKSYQNLSRQNKQAFRDITDQIKTQKSKLIEQTQSTSNLVKDKYQNKEIKEIEECTFKPQINSRTPRLNPSENLPKGYYEMINRIRKVTEEKKALEHKIQKKVIGENYDKVKLMNLKPPSFLQEEERRKKKKLLMYIDVNINPTKTGRIGIYEGDDIRDLVKNFSKTFQLNRLMITLLTQQLEQHLKAYLENHGIQYLGDSTVFIGEDIIQQIHNHNGQHQTQQTYIERQFQPSTQQHDDFESLGPAQDNLPKYSEDESVKHRNLDSLQQQNRNQIPSSVDISNFTYPHTSSIGGIGHQMNQFLPFTSHAAHMTNQDADGNEEDGNQESDVVSYRKEHNSFNELVIAPQIDRKSNIESDIYQKIFNGMQPVGKNDLLQFSLRHNNESFY